MTKKISSKPKNLAKAALMSPIFRQKEHGKSDKHYDRKKEKKVDLRERILNRIEESLIPADNFTGVDGARKYKDGISVLIRTLQFDKDEIVELKKVNWPYGIFVSYHPNNSVTFKTAKIKTLAKLLDKTVDFGSITAAEALNIPSSNKLVTYE